MSIRTARAASFLVLCAASSACGRVGFETPDARAADVPDAPNDVRLAQQAADSMGAVTTLSVTLPTPPAAGNMLVMVGETNIAGITSLSGGSATWTRAIRSTTNPNIEIWFGLADASSTVTIDASVLTGITLSVSEWSGLDAASALDSATAMAGMSTPASTGLLATTNAHDLLIAGIADYLPTTVGDPTDGTWIALNTATSNSIQKVWYQVTTAPGTYSAQLAGTSNRWDAAIAAFRIAP